MGEEIRTRVEREWLSLASINNQGGFDMPTWQVLLGGGVPKPSASGTTEETTHKVTVFLGRGASF